MPGVSSYPRGSCHPHLGFFPVEAYTAWYWKQHLDRSRYQVVTYTEEADLQISVPDAWVIALPSTVSPLACAFLHQPLSARALLITPWVADGRTLAHWMPHPVSVMHPDVGAHRIHAFVATLLHLTSGVLVAPGRPHLSGGMP